MLLYTGHVIDLRSVSFKCQKKKKKSMNNNDNTDNRILGSPYV